MNILEAVLNAQGGAPAREAGRAAGLSPDQVTTALSALVPQLAAGLERNASKTSGLESLLGALSGGKHTQYVDDAQSLGRAGTVADGNAILGHILGSKDTSRAVAARAAGETGLDVSVLKKLLPLAATMVMGSLAKQQAARPGTPGSGGGAGDLLGMLTPVLDRNRDGSVVDDVARSVGKMLGR